jgi:hypothetical protein
MLLVLGIAPEVLWNPSEQTIPQPNESPVGLQPLLCHIRNCMKIHADVIEMYELS